MSYFRLVARSLTYHRRQHLGLLAGVVLACGILTGALLMGDSVAYSLRRIASLRLGRVAYAMSLPGRFFAQDLADRILKQDDRIHPAAVVLLQGMASLPPGNDGTRNQLNRVQVLGVASDFWRFAEEPAFSVALGPQEAAISEQTAAALGVKQGDDLSLRVVKYSLMPLDAPLSSRKDERVMTSLVTVKAVLTDAQFGRFSLAANQTTPYNVFVDRAWLQEQTGQDGLANLMVAGDGVPVDDLDRALDRGWELEDVGLHFRTHASGLVQLESSRVFVDEEVVRAALETPGASATLTYLVNSIAKGERMTPYSFVEAGPVPKDMRDDQVIVNKWLSDELGAGAGDSMDIAYVQLLPTNHFAERQRGFTVHSVVPMADLGVERELAPQFPGLSDVQNCRDWSIGMPMDPARLKDPANEAYWRQYGQTPKLLVTLRAGQDMWANRFGSVTAVRFAGGLNESEVRKSLREKVSPEKLGLRFTPVRKIGLDAVNQAMDFGGLFVGMSLFLIVAALILLGLLYVFGIQQRASEMGLLLAIGFTRGKIRALYLVEACPTAIVGGLLGGAAGVAYARALLAGVVRYWPGAVAGTAIRFHAEPTTLVVGLCTTLVCAFCIVLAAVWRATRRPAHELLTADLSSMASVPAHGKRRLFALLPTLALLFACGVAAYAWLAKPDDFAEPFFVAGTCLLLAGLGYGWQFLGYLSRRASFKRPRLWKIALTNLARRRGRSLSIAGLTACGCFLVFSVSSMQQNVALHADERSSGTGGFRLYAETTAPIVASPADVSKMFAVEAVPLKVHDGDDAGCLNLNRAQTPRLLGVDAQRLSGLGAFVTINGDSNHLFTTERPQSLEARKQINGYCPHLLWDLLDAELPDGVVPALVGDTNTALWGLQKKTGQKDGDLLSYRDESGREVKLKLVGQLPVRLSVFQGAILISDAAFTRMFPSDAGFRAFLIDGMVRAGVRTYDAGSPDAASAIAARLNREFARFGMEAVPSVQRLRDFYAVEATYLAMFLVLGGLGLILGAGGVGVVVLRNVFERRAEVALFHAVGYERATVFRLLFTEHSALVLGGMIVGTLASAASILPLVLFSQTTVSAGLQISLLAVIVVANLASVAVLLLVGLPQNPIPDLRGE